MLVAAAADAVVVVVVAAVAVDGVEVVVASDNRGVDLVVDAVDADCGEVDLVVVVNAVIIEK